MVFYRKYRPQTISDLDLESIRAKLSAVLKSNDLPHAFLFTGPKGLGKTSAARILAKAINCENNSKFKIQNSKLQVKGNKLKEEKVQASDFALQTSSIEPCNKCSACISITNGSNMDVLEIDAASNRGVDEIRELRERIKFSPASLLKKVYIIDEVHMLTTEAFNALLKTLEEPPSHAVFILCTTQSWKLPTTITSRTFIVQFEKPSREELLRSIKRIVEGEMLDIEKKVLEKIYNLSEGSFRDGSKILEELVLAAEKGEINENIFEKTFKTKTIDQSIQSIIKSLAQKNAKEALQILSDLANLGVDFKLVTEKIVDHLRKLLLLKAGIEQDVADIDKFSRYDIQILLENFQKAYEQLKFTPLPQLPLELVVIEWSMEEVGNLKFSSGASIDTRRVETGEVRSLDKGNETRVQSLEAQKVGLITEKNIEKAEKPEAPGLPPTEKAELVFEKKEVTVLKPLIVSSNNTLLYQLIDEIKKENQSVAAVLRSCKILEEENKIEIIAPFKFHKDKLSDEKNINMLTAALSSLLGKKIEINIVLKDSN